jgi:hypothetical protein
MTDAVLQAPVSGSSVSASAARKWKGVKAALRIGRRSEDHASFHLLSLARANLGVRLRAIDEASLASDSQKRIFSSVTEMLKAPAKANANTRNLEWDEIYKAESLIALLYGGEQLRQEIGLQMQELARVNPAEADALRQDYLALPRPPGNGASSTTDDGVARAFLLRVMEAVHWNAKKQYLAQPLRVEATTRVLACLLISFCLLVVPYIFLIWDYDNAHSRIHKLWSLFALYTALTAGLLGAFSSRLNGIQRQWANMSLDEVFLQRQWPYTLLRAGVGVCGALVVYFFLRSGIADGPLFPKFDEIRIELVSVAAEGAVPMAFVMPSKALALLTFWCFLAGFSETLVSSILTGTEQQLSNTSTSGQPSRR